MTFQSQYANGLTQEATGFSNDALLYDLQSAAITRVTGATSTTYRYTALFGRLNYNFLDKYILNVSMRRDGSNRFGPGKRFGTFTAAGAAWIFSNEPFVKNDLSFMSFGKLRASYGTTGNDGIGSYRYVPTYSSNLNPYQGIKGLNPNNLGNPEFAWELTRKLEFGMDLGFLKDRILVNASYYRNHTGNQLLGYILPEITGFNQVTSNLPAKIQNSGLEISLNSIQIKNKDFSWSTGFNFTRSRNKLLAFPNFIGSGYESQLVIGQSLYIQKLFHVKQVDPETGMFLFADKDGNDVSFPNFETDRIVNIDPSPGFYGGIQNNFSYKGFSFGFNVQFVKQLGKNYLWNLSGSMPGTGGGNFGNQPATVLSRWQKQGDVSDVQLFTQNYSAFLPYLAALTSDITYSDASFVRLKNLSLSYSLPLRWSDNIGFKNLRIYMHGQNLFTITNFKGMDPENQSFNSLPPLKVYTIGLHFEL